MAVKTKSQHYQTIVIGGGLTGLLIASRLSQSGETVALVEELDQVGGEDRAHLSTFGAIDHGLKFIPATGESEKALSLLQQVLPDLEWETQEAPPYTYDSGQLKPFVGFGAKALEAVEMVEYYTSPSRLVPNLPVRDWIEALAKGFQGDLFLRSFVTFIHHEQNRVTGLGINSKEKLTADRYVFCGQLKELMKYGFATQVAGRTRQKISKAEFWTSIKLEVFHSQQVTDQNNVHVLWSPSEESSPCIGVFHPSQRNQDIIYQHSQWMTFVPFELTEDSEITGTAVRKIKKQIKRAYPEAFDKLHGEIILIGLGSHGHVSLKSRDGGRLQPFKNFYIATPQLEALNPVIGSILQAEHILTQWSQTEDLFSLEVPEHSAAAGGPEM